MWLLVYKLAYGHLFKCKHVAYALSYLIYLNKGSKFYSVVKSKNMGEEEEVNSKIQTGTKLYRKLKLRTTRKRDF